MLLRTIEMPARTYPSFGCCIFCGSREGLTDEHIVPEALTGIGEMKIERGSCLTCNNGANERYEQPALKNDFLPIRYMLELRRKKRGKKATPARISGFASQPLGLDIDSTDASAFDLALDPADAPPFCEFMVHPPAGLLVAEDRSAGSTSIRIMTLGLGRPIKDISRSSFASRLPMVMGAPEMMVAKMAYCYAICETRVDFGRYTDLRDLLLDRRDDVFNFVGEPVARERLAATHLHAFYFRQREHFRTVIVHLFASYSGPAYEVVLEAK